MVDHTQGDMYPGEPAFYKVHPHGVSTNENDMQELERSLQVLTEIDFRLAYSSEKLVNLHVLFIYIFAEENDLEAICTGNNSISTDFIEKALVFDLLSSILDSEVRELDNFMGTVQEELVDARHKIFSSRHMSELFTMTAEKLHGSEESLKQFQEQFLDLKMQSSKLQRTTVAFLHENWEMDKAINFRDSSQLIDLNAKSNKQMVEQKRYILRMLEKSLARELDLEKKLAESRNNEDLKLKLHYTEQVAFRMEEAAEVVWGRFLEAESSAEVLMGISKDLVGRLQCSELNLSGSLKREQDLKLQVLEFIEQLKAKDSALQNLESNSTELIKNNAEVFTLREKVKLLEEQQKELKFQLHIVNTENDASQDNTVEMDNVVGSLKEIIYIAESRVESAEAKVTQLTETNLELTEEMSFLKSSAANTEEKVGTLEKQLRELEIQLQHAKASSEASQEQQNMLYSAIWDMETLIEDLKSKVSKAESKTDRAKEQYILLSENNLELNKELNLLRFGMKSLKTSLDEANNSKFSIAKEVNVRTKFIMDMIMQLSMERERIQKQLYMLRKENKLLVDKIQNTKRETYENGYNHGDDDEDPLVPNDDSTDANCTKESEEVGREPSDKNFQVDVQSEDANQFETEVGDSISPANNASKKQGFKA
ncbi:WPP domain-interacting tail-anchored protein [Quillaja saponaria]|uniref:WPP domain-interacting tail-anchored protein n=1 Tax=Quillaja saponaria TaxID=32244 RepID=A0AAD7P618_QUISA|nr:WPP domain-interacting tail-anchored protein [Quillaja saponaria]